MKKFLMVSIAGLMLVGCAQSRREYNAFSGAIIGGGTGAAIGGITSESAGGALAGGLVGAAAGGIIGAALTSEPCYIRTRSGKLRRVRCY
jgi:osmotically inducible lipoprotein OsmB